mgnify:CR=1 FL=1
MPKRIQMRRTKGWRKPEGAIYVGRPSKWGNMFRIGEDHSYYAGPIATKATAAQSAELYGRFLVADGIDLSELRGHDLACWCPLDQPCHADVLLELANA